jgi:hypothetical protein
MKGNVADRLAAFVILLFLGLLAGAPGLSFPVRPLLWHGVALLWWPVLLTGALGQGLALRRLLHPRSKEGAMAGLFLAGTAGLGLLALETFLLGVLGAFRPWILALLALGSLGAALAVLRRWVREEGSDLVREAREGWGEGRIPLALTGLLVLLAFFHVLVPTTFFDALAYHLEVPARFLQAGGVCPIPENSYAAVPLLQWMLNTLALGLAGGVLAQLVHFSFFLLALGLAWSWSRRILGGAAAAWGTVLIAALPPFLVETAHAGTDWPTACFTLAAVFLLAGDAREPGRMALAGICAGCAAGTKYPALATAFLAPLAAGVLTDLWGRKPARETIRTWAVFLAAAMAAAAPWYLLNLVFTGDPFYPLFSLLPAVPGGGATLMADMRAVYPAWSDAWTWILVPWRFVYSFSDFALGTGVGVLPLALLPALFALRGRWRGSRFLALWMALASCAWYASFRIGRFTIPQWTVVCIFLGAGLAALLAAAGKARRPLAAAVIAGVLVNAAVFLGVNGFAFHNTLAVLGIEDPERHLESNYEPYAAIRFLNRMEPPPGKVLFVGETRAFHSGFPREVPSYVMPNRLVEMARAGKTPGEMAEGLARAGVTHLLVSPAEMRRIGEDFPLLRVDGGAMETLERFYAGRTRKLFTANGVSVLEVIGG